MSKYNQKLSQLAGLITAFASEVENDPDLKTGEKFLLLQRFFADTVKITKSFENLKNQIEDFAKNNLQDIGDGKSPETEFEGASVFVKYSYPKDQLDTDKLKTCLERAYNELNIDFDETQFLKPTTPRRQVIIQSILNK